MTWNLYEGDCLEVMKDLEDNSIDAVVTDPPYGWKFMGKSWDYSVPSVEVWGDSLPNEKTFTDQFVRKNLDAIGLPYGEQGSSILDIREALKNASKTGKGGIGKPEFIAQSGEFLIIIEDKLENDKNIKLDEENKLDLSTKATTEYAVNGAVHYARHIANNSSFKKIFAIGVTEDERHNIIQPVYCTKEGYTLLHRVETFENFNEDNIEEYFRSEILGETPAAQIQLQEIIKLSKELHEDLRNYGQLTEQEKPLVVSAILLALEDEKNFKPENLIGDEVDTDGKKIINALSNYLVIAEVQPESNKNIILEQFNFIATRVKLNDIDSRLGKTPLRHFTDFINDKIKEPIKNNINDDILGRFYGEFVKYSGGDGKGLGVVLTPSHITELMCDLVDIKSNDIVLDPAAGTGGFLISAMYKMLKDIDNEEDKEKIKKEQIHGIEIREDFYSIATTNMILRGDGKSNLRKDDFIENVNIKSLKKLGITVGLMNPPYSQAKNESTAHLSELSFIERLLDSLQPGARCAVIIPQSAMVGKTKRDKNKKDSILIKHTLESVITLNKDTFYHIGVNPCIVIFNAGIKHDSHKRVKFINFEDDGYEVKKHIGLVATETAKDRRKKLLDVYFDKADAASSFIVKSTVEPDDEWLHSFYYFNDEIPSIDEFKKTISDFLTFEFYMKSQGKSYLFEENGDY